MVEKIVRSKIALEPGYEYFVDDGGDVSRAKFMASRCRRSQSDEKIATFGLERAAGYLYFIDRVLMASGIRRFLRLPS